MSKVACLENADDPMNFKARKSKLGALAFIGFYLALGIWNCHIDMKQ